MPWVRAKCKDCGEIVIRPIGEEVICKDCGRRFRIPDAPEAYVIPRQIRSIPDLTSTGRTKSPKVSTLGKGIGRPRVTSGGRIGGLGGASQGTQSWEVKPLPQTGPKRQAVLERDLLVDVFDEDGQILVVTELPGVREEEIETRIEDQTLILKAKGKKRKYHRKIELPCEVGEHESRYQNGILELRFLKKT